MCAGCRRQMAPLRGAAPGAGMDEDDEGLLPAAAAADGCLTVIFEVGDSLPL